VPNVEMERLLNEIGQLIAESRAHARNDTLLHAEVAANFVAPSIFEDVGDHVQYRDADRRLTYALLDLWEVGESDKRWAEIEYVIRGSKFDAKFIYPEELDLDEDPLEHRGRVVERYFGKKLVSYPPPPAGAMEFKP